METEVGMLELLALNMKKGATSQGMQATSERIGDTFAPGASRGNIALLTPRFGTSDCQKYGTNFYCLNYTFW